MSAPPFIPPPTRPPLRSPLLVQWTVVHALFVRSLTARFGQLRGGFAWAFIEPLMQVLFFTLLFYMRGRHELNNIPIPMLVITGLSPFILFRQITMGGDRAIRQAGALFNYRMVKPIDPILAQVMNHGVFFVFTLTVFAFVCHTIHLRIEQVIPLELVVNIGLLTLLALGMGLLFTVLMTLVPEARKISAFVVRPLFFISGIFFTADSIPSDYREYFLLNPLLHVTEITRSCFYYSYPSHGRLDYLAMCALVSITLGLLVFHLNRHRLIEE